MELRQLKTFQTVAALLSFNRAAKLLNYAQSTVSAQIRGLEEDLDVQLFDRLDKQIVLTEAGRRLLAYARKITDLTEETRAEVTGGDVGRGSLTIRVPESLCTWRMIPVLTAFRERFPDIRLTFTTCAYHDLRQDLGKGITDLAFLLADAYTSRSLSAEFLGTERLEFVAAPGHPQAGAHPAPLAALAGELFLLTRTDCSYRRTIESILADEGVEARVMEMNCVSAIKEATVAGVGISVLPRVACRREMREGTMTSLAIHHAPLETGILMIRHREKWLSPSLECFMDLAREHLAKEDAPL